MVGGTACGLCGIISLDMAIRPLPKASAMPIIRPEAIRSALARLPEAQAIHRQTGAVHAAGIASLAGEILLAREDVGRHNALDKLIGAATRLGLDLGQSILLLTSRCSTEMIQKAATAGFTMVVAISAPTSLAIELAEDAGLTLVAFARGGDFTVYTRLERIAQTMSSDEGTAGHDVAHASIVKMANQIAMAFRTSPDAAAAAANHMAKFWDPRMRAQLQAVVNEGGYGLDPIAQAAAAHLAVRK